jgi:hypothetical protein
MTNWLFALLYLMERVVKKALSRSANSPDYASLVAIPQPSLPLAEERAVERLSEDRVSRRSAVKFALVIGAPFDYAQGDRPFPVVNACTA